LYVENIGSISFRSWHAPTHGLFINGREWGEGHILYGWGGISWSVRPGELLSIPWDLSEELKAPGQYVLQYRFGDGCSNEIVIRVREKP
jgi:hypothetical protein